MPLLEFVSNIILYLDSVVFSVKRVFWGRGALKIAFPLRKARTNSASELPLCSVFPRAAWIETGGLEALGNSEIPQKTF